MLGLSAENLARRRRFYYLFPPVYTGDTIFPARFVIVNDPAVRSLERPKALNYA